MRGGEYTFLCIAAAVLACILGVLIALRFSTKTVLRPPAAAVAAADAAAAVIDSLYSTGGAPMAKALLLGRKDGIPRDTREDYRRSGASHLLALSGLHLGMFYGLLSALFIRKSRTVTRIKAPLCIAVTGFYAMMTGMSDSTARAFIMISVYEIAAMTSRKQKPLHVLACAAAVTLSINPRAVLSVGFQLSYSAMLGIFLLYPHLRALVETKTKAMEHIWNSIALSVSCQAATLPAVLGYFGYFPKYFIVTNLLCIPLMSLVLPLLAASVALWPLWPEAAQTVALAASAGITVLGLVNGHIASLP